jgi:hypothetical protein
LEKFAGMEERKLSGRSNACLGQDRSASYHSCGTPVGIDVVELIELGRAIGFDPADMVRKLSRR